MNIESESDLINAFQYEIIPLLQDYFYDDYELLEEILGNKIISKTEMQINLSEINLENLLAICK